LLKQGGLIPELKKPRGLRYIERALCRVLAALYLPVFRDSPYFKVAKEEDKWRPD